MIVVRRGLLASIGSQAGRAPGWVFMKWHRSRQFFFLCAAAFLFLGHASAQFIDDFNGPSVQLDPDGIKGWLFRPGDGTATMDFREGGDSYASILVDGTMDKRGIWWALI